MLPDGSFLRTGSGQILKYTAVPATAAQSFSPSTVIGGVPAGQATGDNVPGNQAILASAAGLATGAAGDLYIADSEAGTIRKLDTKGILTTVAGSVTATYPTPDGTPALQTVLRNPSALAVAPSGDIYYAEDYAFHVRKISTDGTVTTVAGNGQPPGVCCSLNSGIGGLATSASVDPSPGWNIEPRRYLDFNGEGYFENEMDQEAGKRRCPYSMDLAWTYERGWVMIPKFVACDESKVTIRAIAISDQGDISATPAPISRPD